MTHLFFNESKSDSGKTKIVCITSNSDDSFLGEIRFSGRWRQYVYIPSGNDIMWSWECLELLCNLCDTSQVASYNERRYLIA